MNQWQWNITSSVLIICAGSVVTESWLIYRKTKGRCQDFVSIAKMKFSFSMEYMLHQTLKYLLRKSAPIVFFKIKNAKVLCETTKLDNEKYVGVKERAKIISDMWQCHKQFDCKACKQYDSQSGKGCQKSNIKREDQEVKPLANQVNKTF